MFIHVHVHSYMFMQHSRNLMQNEEQYGHIPCSQGGRRSPEIATTVQSLAGNRLYCHNTNAENRLSHALIALQNLKYFSHRPSIYYKMNLTLGCEMTRPFETFPTRVTHAQRSPRVTVSDLKPFDSQTFQRAKSTNE
ncbi:unnamed protein product [Prunus armeniaca]